MPKVGGRKYRNPIDLRCEIAAQRMLVALEHLSRLVEKANFNPNQPRVPRGRREGGQWTRDGTGTEPESSPPPSSPPIRIGGDDDPLEIPRDRPETERERNAVAKRTAAWLLRSGFRLGLRLSPVGRVLDAIDLGLWLYEKTPLIDAYLDPPKALEELQHDLGMRKPGYETHHIIEEDAARKAGFPERDIQARENKVLIPIMQHWRLTGWYMRPNESLGGVTPPRVSQRRHLGGTAARRSTRPAYSRSAEAMNASLRSMTVEQLVERFAEIGMAQDEAILYDDHGKYNVLFRRMDEVDEELRSRGLSARLALLRLYEHANIQVRLKAAVRTLAVAPVEARRLLEEIALRKDVPQGGDAGMSLWNLDRGVFTPT
jgi:hypothetical protein